MKNAVPLVSTVILTFNRSSVVRRAIDSALQQTHSRQEIIVIDDGSSDGTGDSLRGHYGERIRYVRQANGGVSSARNHGMRLANGEFIALLDSDDEWEPGKLEKQVDFLCGHPDYGMVVTDVRRIDANRNTIDIFRRRDVTPKDGDVFADVLLNPALAPASAMLRKEVFLRLGGFDESLRTAEDIEFHLRVAASCKIGVIEECLTVAMRSGDGLSSDANSDSDYVRVVENVIRKERDRISPGVRDATLFRTYSRAARSAFVSGRMIMGSGYMIHALLFIRSLDDVSAMGRLVLTGAKSATVRILRRTGGKARSTG